MPVLAVLASKTVQNFLAETFCRTATPFAFCACESCRKSKCDRLEIQSLGLKDSGSCPAATAPTDCLESGLLFRFRPAISIDFAMAIIGTNPNQNSKQTSLRIFRGRLSWKAFNLGREDGKRFLSGLRASLMLEAVSHSLRHSVSHGKASR